MFYIFLLQTHDSVYEIETQQSIDFNVNELMNDVDIGSSLNPMKVIEKTLKKINADILHLLFMIPQTYEIKSKVELLVNRSHVLQVSCGILNHNINPFSTL